MKKCIILAVLVGLGMIGSCGNAGLIAGNKKIDATNADTFSSSLSSIVEEMPEIERQRLFTDILFLYYDPKVDRRFYAEDLYPEVRTALNSRDIVLKVGDQIDRKSVDDLAQIANRLRREKALAKADLAKLEAEKELKQIQDSMTCMRRVIQENPTPRAYGGPPVRSYASLLPICDNLVLEYQNFLNDYYRRREVLEQHDYSNPPEFDLLRVFFSETGRRCFNQSCPR